MKKKKKPNQNQNQRYFDSKGEIACITAAPIQSPREKSK